MSLSAPTRYPTLPGDDLAQAFLDHVAKTGTPETFPGIDHSTPAENWGFEIITRFRINPLKRPNADMAPCPVCLPDSPKFLEGVLVWDRIELVLRAIGNQCGSAQTKAAREAAMDRFLERSRQKKIAAELYSWLPQAEALYAQSVKAHRFTEHAQNLREKLRGDAKTFGPKVADEANMNSGQLTYVEEFTDLDGKPQSARRHLGAVAGLPFLLPGFKPETHRQSAESLLRDAGRGDFVAARRWLAEHAHEPSELAACHEILMKGVKALTLAREQVLAAQAFFRRTNLETIGRWGRLNSFQEFVCRSTAYGVLVRGPSRDGKRMEALLVVDEDRLAIPAIQELLAA